MEFDYILLEITTEICLYTSTYRQVNYYRQVTSQV